MRRFYSYVPKSIGWVISTSPTFITTSSTVHEPSVMLLILAVMRSPLYDSLSMWPNSNVPFSNAGFRLTVNTGESSLACMNSMKVPAGVGRTGIHNVSVDRSVEYASEGGESAYCYCHT